MSTAIKVENLSKMYQLGEIGTGTISRDLERWYKTKILRKEDPFLKIGETNDRANKGASDFVYSLKNINFEINQGDAVGIIGRNGAGKSTLLKVLSQVTSPTTGNVKVKGRIASLLEVGTGFHPELTGRENIYLNGAILGMRKAEIKRKFDEIVDFAGVERYIDTPVKRYSSGMYVRLAFAVAAHLESEILIVDEVLAVGDAEFQKKCLGKMGDISKGEGRTVLFVSHNLGSVQNLCNKGLMLFNGQLKADGNISSVITSYIDFGKNDNLFYKAIHNNKRIFISECWLGSIKEQKNDFLNDEILKTNISITVNEIDEYSILSFTLQSLSGEYLSTFVKPLKELKLQNGKIELIVDFKCKTITPGSYYIRLAIFNPMGMHVYDLQELICPFKVIDNGSDMAAFEGTNYGYFNLDYIIHN
jgi:lipopolysaccharide transport system ATP-binding protein